MSSPEDDSRNGDPRNGNPENGGSTEGSPNEKSPTGNKPDGLSNIQMDLQLVGREELGKESISLYVPLGDREALLRRARESRDYSKPTVFLHDHLHLSLIERIREGTYFPRRLLIAARKPTSPVPAGPLPPGGGRKASKKSNRPSGPEAAEEATGIPAPMPPGTLSGRSGRTASLQLTLRGCPRVQRAAEVVNADLGRLEAQVATAGSLFRWPFSRCDLKVLVRAALREIAATVREGEPRLFSRGRGACAKAARPHGETDPRKARPAESDFPEKGSSEESSPGRAPPERASPERASPEGIHYSIREGQKDGVIVPVHFKLRHEAEWSVDEAAMDEAFEEEFAGKPKDEKLRIIRESLTQSELGELEPRIDTYAELVAEHYRKKVEPNGWKGMVVAPSRKSAAMYGERLQELRGDPEDVRVLYTSDDEDPDLIAQFSTGADERSEITRKFDDEKQPRLLVVYGMLLTGFDAPTLKTMYLDRRLTDHTLLQAIARTNRPAEGKTNGEIVDFQGTFANLDDALHYDSDVVEHAAQSEEKLFEKFEKQLDAVFSLFEGIEKTNTQEAIQEALARVSKHPERREFKQGYKRLQDLYESVSPDKRLMEPEVQDPYGWLSGIWVAFSRTEGREEDPEENVREKTLGIVEEHVDVGKVKEDFPIYKIGEEHLGAIENQEPAAKASSIAATTKAHLRPKIGENPRYERLSERVEEVLSQWQSGHIGDPEAVDALEELEREAMEVDEEAEEKGFSGAEYAAFAYLHDECDLAEGEAQRVAEALCEALDEEVDTSYSGWWTNTDARRKIKVKIYQTLSGAETPGDMDLMTAGSELRDYLIASYVDHPNR